MADTIAAISTASGAGAIGILRVSGPEALQIAYKHLSFYGDPPSLSSIQPRYAYTCRFIDGEKKLDQVVFLYFAGPNSFTGENLCEIHTHGNPILLREALECLFQSGARPAKQGEFTKRAFLNAKLDLNEAEAIGRIIGARSRFELELAQKNAFGEISRLTSNLRSQLISLKAECEAEIDFSTEDLTFESFEQRKGRIRSIVEICNNLLRKSSAAETLLERSRVVLYGEPNTGKSSLMNLILGKDRSIISEIPGTTRDYISEEFLLSGVPIRLIDTAGVRETGDRIEKMGIERSEKEFSQADVRVLVLDVSQETDWAKFAEENRSKLEGAIIAANKSDIRHASWNQNLIDRKNYPGTIVVEISCKAKTGLDVLIQKISEKLQGLESSEDYVLLEERNRFHFTTIVRSLENCLSLMSDGAPAEIYIKEIDSALEEIGEVNGRVDTEEILGRIFSKFCVGK
ncbi:tRNA uridine-5-carboxymethylaminomethyl(34) synthesis GTPase MnmE [Leptospira langatensis]|uniref:tRNA modification GTPase MnmE n=1 Tax=Leptospira langatensis TaxID=2484983 RepID=A0A5F1ZTH6_9LEPT|nr:tRNA uridine-5-carboxymethylaminomethyl(34) synthesis GTPase MnmE [Leptospira langatensis]TGK02998.1 tRNA uridine-5-carboxymethylaminomethyl(34) synthesis GTPase MnmE [Leptospira langatensis]TGL41753.1 tRNA uridine-5-carboxymethylaminomethyl(34) synthesis GTPase MnmE [Leptospira langatensis]